MASFIVLLFAFTLSQFYRSFLAVVSGDLVRDLGLDAAGFGSLSAAWFAAFAFAQFPVGFALDRFGPRRTLAITMAAAVVGAAWFATSTGFAAACAAMILIGIGCAPALMAGLYVFARAYPSERFALLGATLIGVGSLGNLLGSAPLALAAARFGWRPSMLAIAAATAACCLAIWWFLRDPPPIESAAGDQSLLGGLRAVASIRALWPLLPIAAVSYAVVIAVRSVWIVPALASAYPLGPAGLSYAVAAMAAGMSLGSLALGPMERWLGAKRTTALGSGVAAVALLALGLLLPGPMAGGVAVAIALLSAIGFFGMTYAILMAHARLFLPAALIGRGVTFMNFAFIGGAGVVQWLSGRTVAAALAAGLPADAAYGRLFVGYAAALGAALVLYGFAPAGPAPSPVTRPARGP